MKENCKNFEQLLALYVEDDLSRAECSRVEAHVQECSACHALAEDLRESQAMFKSIRQDIPDAAATSVVRERVLSEVDSLDSVSWIGRLFFGGLRRKAAFASVALALIGAGAFWVVRSARTVPAAATANSTNSPKAPPVASVIPSLDPQPRPVPARAVRKNVRRRNPAPAPPPESAEAPKQVAIKLLTDDPNVIIYWLVDEKGD